MTYIKSLMITVEVTNRVKGLELINRVPEELWMEVHKYSSDQSHPHETEM